MNYEIIIINLIDPSAIARIRDNNLKFSLNEY